MNRKDKTVKQLQAECRKRTIGFMMNWTKAALVKRLEDEDNREKWYEEQMANKEKEIDDITIKLFQTEKKVESSRNASAEVPIRLLESAKRQLKQEKTIKLDVEEKIKLLHKKKTALGTEWSKSNSKIKELEALVKSLI